MHSELSYGPCSGRSLVVLTNKGQNKTKETAPLLYPPEAFGECYSMSARQRQPDKGPMPKKYLKIGTKHSQSGRNNKAAFLDLRS